MATDKGLSIFMTKNAEAEPWLVPHAFVPPPEFEFFKDSGSRIIYARSGMGKTAISYALGDYARNVLHCLPVRWKPDFTSGPQSPGTEVAMVQLSSILFACAHEILCLLPERSKKRVKNDKLDLVADFLHNFAPKEDQQLLKKKVPSSKGFQINRNAPLEGIATDLVTNVKNIGYPGGIWIMVDGMTWNSDRQKQYVVDILRSILSTLSFFDIPNLHFKMVMPMELERDLAETTALVKERVTASRISWEEKHLRMMIEKRLRLALEDERVQADQIYPAEELLGWLEACGGLSPRGWLEFFRPIFASVWENYSTEGLRRLHKKEWIAARKRSSLQLRFYPESSQVVVGMNAPKTLSQEEMAIFSYLYKNEGRYCSKREIYYKAYMPFYGKGRSEEIDSDDKFAYEDLVNTAIHRLRKSIEPLPKNPVFLTTKKELGYRLSLQAFLGEGL